MPRRHRKSLSKSPETKHVLTLEYWPDDGWFVGRLKEVPEVFSQAETLQGLEENILDAYRMMRTE